jgi:hypothetical protein
MAVDIRRRPGFKDIKEAEGAERNGEEEPFLGQKAETSHSEPNALINNDTLIVSRIPAPTRFMR